MPFWRECSELFPLNSGNLSTSPARCEAAALETGVKQKSIHCSWVTAQSESGGSAFPRNGINNRTGACQCFLWLSRPGLVSSFSTKSIGNSDLLFFSPGIPCWKPIRKELCSLKWGFFNALGWHSGMDQHRSLWVSICCVTRVSLDCPGTVGSDRSVPNSRQCVCSSLASSHWKTSVNNL